VAIRRPEIPALIEVVDGCGGTETIQAKVDGITHRVDAERDRVCRAAVVLEARGVEPCDGVRQRGILRKNAGGPVVEVAAPIDNLVSASCDSAVTSGVSCQKGVEESDFPTFLREDTPTTLGRPVPVIVELMRVRSPVSSLLPEL
jgi:hypothetical protein